MRIANYIASLTAITASIAVSITPAFAIPNTEILSAAYMATEDDNYVLDTAIPDINAAIREFSAYVYADKPELFLSCADYSGPFNGLNFGSCPDNNCVTSVSFTRGFLAMWNDPAYADNFWNYIDSVIATAGITSTDTPAEKVRKVAVSIGSNYCYDWQDSYAQFLQGTPFFETLADNQISFCMPDSRLFMACCIRLCIPCTYLEGYANGLHAWNRVYVNGLWREVDVSFARKARNKDNYIFFTSGRPIYTEIG